MVAFLLVIFCMMGALYPALDTVSGEKERGTLETLLSIPASRLEIMSGKYAAVFAMSLASVAANFLSLSITMLLVTELLEGAASTAGMSIDFSIPPAAVMLLVPALVPLAAFFSAISLGIAAFARSTREGQYYLGPLYAVALPLTAAAIVPGMQLTYLTALVPIMSISLFLKDGFLGTLPVMPAILAVVAQCAYAFAALKWAVAVFSREEVLFASPSAEGEETLATRGYARPTQIFVTWAVSAILFFYVGGLLQQRTGALSVVTGVMAYGGFVLGPLVVLFFVGGLDARKILPLGALDGRALAAGALFIPAAMLVNVAANAVQYSILAPPEAAANMFRMHQSASYAALFVSVVLLPAVCEEVFYRGMVFNSLAARMSAGWAVILSSALFAMAHFSPYEAAPLFALGVVLALAMRSSGTLLLPIIIHFANNGVTITVARMGYNPEIGWLGAAAAGVAGVALAAAGVRILRRRKAA
jgi:sodium transport system permease protein